MYHIIEFVIGLFVYDYLSYKLWHYKEQRKAERVIAEMRRMAELGRVAPNAQPNQRPMAKKVAWIASLVLGFAALYLVVQVATTISSS